MPEIELKAVDSIELKPGDVIVLPKQVNFSNIPASGLTREIVPYALVYEIHDHGDYHIFAGDKGTIEGSRARAGLYQAYMHGRSWHCSSHNNALLVVDPRNLPENIQVDLHLDDFIPPKPKPVVIHKRKLLEEIS